jgi:NAD(P)-dependent dehydrogenase (short-subunit alcohol dehydrogenase family)
MSMPDQAVVVTGASGGIGAACVEHLAARGFEVFAAARRPGASQLHTRWTGRILDLTLDVTDEASCARAVSLVEAAVDRRGLAGLVNNAGICTLGPLELTDRNLVRQQFEVNVFGVIAVTRAFLPLLRRGRGRVVNMGSIAGRSTLPGTGAYSASKRAVVALTEALRMEVRQWGMHAALVEPGAIDTPLWDTLHVHEAGAPEVRADYELVVQRLRSAMADSRRDALAPEAVARAIHHALTARRPRTRYLVGRDARLRALLQWLPDTWRERLYAHLLGFPIEPQWS